MSESLAWKDRTDNQFFRAEFKLKWSGERIKQFRLILGLSQGEFGQLIGVKHQSNVTFYEQGRDIKQIETMQNILHLYENWKASKIKQLETELEYIRNF